MRWLPTPIGSRLADVPADVLLFKRGRTWLVSINGAEHALPKRATFDHAESVVRRELGL